MSDTDNINVGIGLSTEKDIGKAVKEAMQQARTTIYKEAIDLALVFSSTEYASPHTTSLISNLIGSAPVIGCSGAAIISNKGIFRSALGLMLLSFPKTVFLNSAHIQNIHSKTALTSGEELGEKLLHGFKGGRRDFGLFFTDGLIEEESNLILGLQEKLGTSFPIIGASASDNLKFEKTYTYYNQDISNDSACGIIWGGKLNFGWGIKHGWKPLGKPRTITKSKSNVVYEIDGLPATKIYEEYFSRNIEGLRKELKRISTFYPIGIYLRDEEEYLLRNIHLIENSGALVFQGNVPEGSEVRLMIGTKESCLNATEQACEQAKNWLPGKNLSFALVFDSISRYLLLGRRAIKEIEIINTELNNIPILGLYTYGEQAPLKATNYQGRAHNHNQTITILGVEG